MSEKFPRYFLIALALYAFSFVVMMGYLIIPASQYGLAVYVDFYIYLLLTLLPLILLVIYMKTEFAESHAATVRLSIVISTVALSLIFIFMISPLL